jgi:hypothetical protein
MRDVLKNKGVIMKNVALVVVSVIFLGCIGCATEGENRQKTVEASGMELVVEPGEHWQSEMKILFFSLNINPQMAAWLEDDQGNYVSTITVTHKSAKQNSSGSLKKSRPEALPVWYNKTNDTVEIDSVSSATPKGAVDVQIDKSLLTTGKEYTVYLEINHSFDYNETWPEKKNDVNGQPSLLYGARFIAGTSGKVNLDILGRGSASGSDGNIVLGIDGMTTALTIIKEACIIIK